MALRLVFLVSPTLTMETGWRVEGELGLYRVLHMIPRGTGDPDGHKRDSAND